MRTLIGFLYWPALLILGMNLASSPGVTMKAAAWILMFLAMPGLWNAVAFQWECLKKRRWKLIAMNSLYAVFVYVALVVFTQGEIRYMHELSPQEYAELHSNSDLGLIPAE
jgi:hypothetical protein